MSHSNGDMQLPFIYSMNLDKKKKLEEKKALERSYEHVVNELQSRRGPNVPQTTIRDFTTHKLLGQGTYGKVLLVLHRKTGKYYAMKVLKKKAIRQFGQVGHTLSERRILERA